MNRKDRNAISMEGLELIKRAEGLYKKAREKYDAGDFEGALREAVESVEIQKEIARLSDMPFFGSDSEFLRQKILKKQENKTADPATGE